MKYHELAKVFLWESVRGNDVPDHLTVDLYEHIPQKMKNLGVGLPKLFSLRCFDNENGKLFQSWEFSDYLEYGDTLSHIFEQSDQFKITGCYFQSVAVYSGGFELVLWEKRYE